jgi:hypothetical protein
MSFVISLLFGIVYFTALRHTSIKKVFKLMFVRLGIAAAFIVAMLMTFKDPMDPVLIVLGFVVAQLLAVPILRDNKYDGRVGDRH